MLAPASCRRITAEDLWNIPRVATPAPAPDGSFVVVSVATYGADGARREQLFYIPTATPEKTRPLTSIEASSAQPTVSLDGKRVAFVRSPPGEEREQLYVIPIDGGEARRLTSLPLGVTSPRWMPDGRQVLVLAPLYRGALTPEGTRKLAEERKKQGEGPRVTEDRMYRYWDRWLTDGEVHHVFLVDAVTGVARDLTPGSERWFDLMDPDGEFDVSPDGAEVTFSANMSQPPHHVMRYALFAVKIGAPDGNAAAEPRLLTADNAADDKRPRYSPDGRFIVYGAKRDISNYADRVRLVRLDRETGEHTTLTEDWDISPTTWEFSGDTLVIEAEAHGRTCLYRMSVAAPSTPVQIASGGTLGGSTPAGDGFVYARHDTACRPPEIARCPIAGGAFNVLTRFTEAALAGFNLGRLEELTFAGAGGAEVHMYLLLPPGYEEGKRYPLMHSIHGGPYGMHADGWHFRWNSQVFAAPGYVVAMVNFHGSSSYGQRFADAILGDWGGKSAEDILRATDALVDRGFVDPSRMAIAGGSFGGYMVAWLATQTDRFACGVAHAAVYNLGALMASDVTQGVERELGGELWSMPRDREAIDRHNPAAHAGAYRTPLLVIHGEKDYRVPVEHGLELYGVLKAKGVSARLVHYPDENHWILKRKNSVHWYGEVHQWLARHFTGSRKGA
jgi:dipeptidyl aminopeptidase/acylaminoacyl peptidase